MAVSIPDFGDQFDLEKWDFREDNIPVYWIGKYPYKARSSTNAHKLAGIRTQIDDLCRSLENNNGRHQPAINNT